MYHNQFKNCLNTMNTHQLQLDKCPRQRTITVRSCCWKQRI